MPNRLKARQGAGAGSVHIAASFGVAGVLTFAFQSLCTHVLGKQGFAPLALLWSATFLTVQVLWIGATQTLGRYVAEREAQGQRLGSCRRLGQALADRAGGGVRARGVAGEPAAHR